MVKMITSRKRISTLIVLLAVAVVSALLFDLSVVTLTIAAILLVITIGHMSLKLSTISKPDSRVNFKSDKKYEPFVSIHVACKNEPASIVNKTVEALSKLDYKNYEIIVINSNNTDKKNWIKIKKCVESHGDKFIFVHLDKVSGFKAGALNHLNEKYMSKKADVVAIVDCDYIVTPNFLTETVGYFKNPKVGIVQAPQDYYNVNKYNVGLFYEYRSFFTLVMHQAQRDNLVNFTGTMGLIRANLLHKGLKWNEWCITEDTEAGTHINSIGYRGVYVDKSLGKGLMPYDYASLARQRQRWVYGNTQIIGKDLFYVLINKAFLINQKISFIAQLVTWYQFELLIAILYLATSIISFILPGNNILTQTSNLLAASILISVIGNLIYFIVGMRKECSFINSFKAFLAHYGLVHVMSSGWIIHILGYPLGFNVTSKERTGNGLHFKQLFYELSTSILLVATVIIGSINGSVNALGHVSIALFIIAEISGVIYLNRSLIKSKEQE